MSSQAQPDPEGGRPAPGATGIMDAFKVWADLVPPFIWGGDLTPEMQSILDYIATAATTLVLGNMPPREDLLLPYLQSCPRPVDLVLLLCFAGFMERKPPAASSALLRSLHALGRLQASEYNSHIALVRKISRQHHQHTVAVAAASGVRAAGGVPPPVPPPPPPPPPPLPQPTVPLDPWGRVWLYAPGMVEWLVREGVHRCSPAVVGTASSTLGLPYAAPDLVAFLAASMASGRHRPAQHLKFVQVRQCVAECVRGRVRAWRSA